jgi:hypothetical protein
LGSRTTRTGFSPSTCRTVRRELSVAMVPAPTTTASTRARNRWSRRMSAWPVT